MTKFWAFSRWISRIILLFSTTIFFLISIRTISDPAGSAAEQGITLSSPLGYTILRVGFGGFPLGFAIIILACLISAQRILIGLSFVATMVAVVLAVRILGVYLDGTASQSSKLIVAEAVLLVLSAIGLFLELGRRRYLSQHLVRPSPAAHDLGK
jgi:hypothetical protein